MDHSPEKKQIRKSLETTLVLHIATLTVGEVLKDSMKALDVLDDRVSRSDGIISGSFDVANGEFIEGVPIDLPKDSGNNYDS